MDAQIQIQCMKKDKDLIIQVARLVGIGHSTFARIATLEKARQILQEYKEAENG